jgi:hypothetical protein
VANIITVAQAKRHLRYPNPDAASPDDVSIQWFIDAADQVIEYHCSSILPHAWDESYDGGTGSIFLRHTPLLSVQNIQEGWGYVNFDLDYVQANSPLETFSLYCYSIDSFVNAEVSRRSTGNVTIPFHPGKANIQIQYTSGESVIPGNVFLAELELVAHWWQNSQLRGVTLAGANMSYDSVEGALYSRDTESGVQNINLGVPYRILELINSHRAGPIFA